MNLPSIEKLNEWVIKSSRELEKLGDLMTKKNIWSCLPVFFVVLVYSNVINLPLSYDRFESPTAISFLYRLAKIFAFMFFIIFGLRKPKELAHALTKRKSLFLLVFLSCISFLWATDFWVTLKEIVIFGVAVGFSAYLANMFSFSDVLRLIVVSNLIGLVLSLLLWLFYPGESWSSTTIDAFGNTIHGFKGSYGQKNILGLMMNLSIFCVWSLGRIKEVSAFYAIFLSFLFGTLLVLSNSVANYLIFFLTIIFSMSFRTISAACKLRKKWLLGSFLILLAIFSVVGLSNSERVLNKFNRSKDLSGRTKIWKESLPLGMERPLLGYGLNSFWPKNKNLANYPHFSSLSQKLGFFPSHGHNGLLDVFLSLGLTGIILVLWSQFDCLLDLFCFGFESKKPQGILFDPIFSLDFMVLFLLSNIVGSTWLGTRSIFFVVWLYLFFLIPTRNRN